MGLPVTVLVAVGTLAFVVALAVGGGSATPVQETPLAGTLDPAGDGSNLTGETIATPGNTSVDNVAVWEEDREVKYSFYGHTPALPRAGEQPTQSDWQWWSLADTVNGTIADGRSPDVAFTRQGWASVVWVAPDHSALYTATFNGTAWSTPETIASPPDGDIYDPAVAFDGNGTGIVTWTRITGTGTDRTHTMRVSVGRGSDWGLPVSLLTGVERSVAPDVAFTDSRNASRQNTALLTWWGIAETETVTCGGDTKEVDIYWPHSVTWNGTFSETEEVPGRPDASQGGYSRSKFPRESKLAVTADQRGNARALWTPEFDTDPCDPNTEDDVEEWTGQWNGSAWEPNTSVEIRDGGPTAGLAYLPDGTLRGVSGRFGGDDERYWPSVSALHRNHGWTVSVEMARPGLAEPIEAVVYDQGDGVNATIDRTQIGVGRNPAVAARTGSPSMPLAEWSYFGYLAADNDLHDPILNGSNSDRAEMQAVGSTSLVNTVILADPNSTHDSTPFPDPGVRYEYVTEGQSVELEHYGNLNTSDPDTLEDYLAYATELYPAERHALDLGSHGYGWMHQCPDYGANDEMHIPEFGQALANTTVTFDHLLFSECLMSQLEVAHEVQDSANIMLGSEEVMPAKGPNFTRRLRNMTEDPHQSDIALATNFVSIFADENGADETFAATALAEVSDVSAAVDSLADAMLANFTANNQSIRRARNRAKSYSEWDFKDLGNYTSLLNRSVDDPAIRAEARNVSDAIDDAIVAEWHGANESGSTGLTTYIEDDAIPPRYGNLSFAGDTDWDTFLVRQNGSTGGVFLRAHGAQQTGLSRVEIVLDGPPQLAIKTSDDSGNTCGLGFSQATYRCTLPLVEGNCNADREGSRVRLTHPPTETITWEIDASRLGTAVNGPSLETGVNSQRLDTEVNYTLTIELIANDTVVRETQRNGTIAPGENVTGTVATVTVAHYANANGVVDTIGLLDAIDDWRANRIDVGFLLDVIDAWRSDDPVT